MTEINAKNNIIRLIIIIVPSVVGGCLVLSCLCCCCVTYYGSQSFMEWRAKQKRMKPKVQPMKRAPAKKVQDSSESDFDRSQAPMRKKN